MQTIGVTYRIHTLTTVPADDATMTAMRELTESQEPGRITVIGNRVVFLTDAELDIADSATLGPEDFHGDLIAWRDYLRSVAKVRA